MTSISTELAVVVSTATELTAVTSNATGSGAVILTATVSVAVTSTATGSAALTFEHKTHLVLDSTCNIYGDAVGSFQNFKFAVTKIHN